MDVRNIGPDVVATEFGPGPGIVLTVTPTDMQPLMSVDNAEFIQMTVENRLQKDGAILFRGFTLAGDQPLRDFAKSFGSPLLDYRFGSTPRTDLGSGVYTSTEYPAHQSIPLHNEQSYTRAWPRRIWFHCVTPSEEGGETPIADSRIIHDRISPALRARWMERELEYVRNYGNGLDLPWETVFGTDDRALVERYCREQGIVCEWKADGTLRTMQRCQAVTHHPVTKEMLWFNQAHLFHISALDPVVQETLLDIAGSPQNLPRNVFHGDGSPLDLSDLAEIRAVLAEVEIRFAWQKDDILMLDNMLFAHGRSPFKGPRKVVVAMAEAYSEIATAGAVVTA